MSPPLVSVLMTAYNREAYIASAIESVLGQTLDDFELLIVDDASTDRTVEVAERYAATDSRIRVSVNPRNLGDYPNRNHAATLARGSLLKYHDSDDLMYPHCLETMVRPLLAEPRAGFALSARGGWPGGPCPMLLTPQQCYEREFLGHGMFFGGPACALFRADVFRDLGGFPEIGPHSDNVFWLNACAALSVVLVPGDLFWYRVHDEQHLQRPDAAYDALPVLDIEWRALSAPDCPLAAEDREQARRNRTFDLARWIARQLRHGRFGVAWRAWRHSGRSIADWVRYLRPPVRHRLAGTPLASDGRYLIPGANAWAERSQD
ncbi:MAG TPA: glycosyltransferase family 2 protein [Vicinamibacterales bacterium]|nr:glycosyltransferase family 2 protein [Vicinamibacterales bacterium]